MRGYVDLKNKKVICQMGSNAVLAMTCDEKHRKFCRSPKRSCQRLQKIFAHRLILDHHSILKAPLSEEAKRLNCYFSAAKDAQSLINDPLNLPRS